MMVLVDCLPLFSSRLPSPVGVTAVPNAENEITYGQSFLCVTLSYESLATVGAMLEVCDSPVFGAIGKIGADLSRAAHGLRTPCYRGADSISCLPFCRAPPPTTTRGADHVAAGVRVEPAVVVYRRNRKQF